MLLERLTRGANKQRLLTASLCSIGKTLAAGAIMLLLGIRIGWFYWQTTPPQRQAMRQCLADSLRWRLAHLADSRHHGICTAETRASLRNVQHTLKQGWPISLLATGLLLASWIGWLVYRGRRASAVGRSTVAPVRRLNRQMKRARQRSHLRIGNSFYVRDTEVEHLLCVGGTGKGKTTFFMKHTERLAHRQVIFDLDGAFIQHFYRPDRDIILSLRDRRSPPWNFFCECDSVFDIEKRAKSMVPTGKKGDEQWLWNYLAQIIFAAVASQLFRQGKTSTRAILQALYAVDREEIAELLKGTLAEAYVAKGMEKMTGSIKGVLSVYINSLRYLKDNAEPPERLFSITRWMQDEHQSDRRLFISVQEDDFELFRPVIAFWLDTAVAAALSLPNSHTRRIWFRYDEVAMLGHLSSLIAGLTRGRKKGLCFVLGAQSFAQFQDNYSPAQASIIFDNCHTKLYFAIEGADTAKWAATDIGETETQEAQEGVSVSASQKGSHHLSASQHTRTKPLINYTQIKSLPKLTAFLTRPGNWPVTKVTFKPFQQSPKHPPWLECEVQPIIVHPIYPNAQTAQHIKHYLSMSVSQFLVNK